MRQIYKAFLAPLLHRRISFRTLTEIHGNRLHSSRRCTPSRTFSFSAPRCQEGSHLRPEITRELETARREARPYQIDKAKLTNAEWEAIRKRSKAIPMVADKEPIDIVYEDDNFLVVNKPSFVKMHPAHRFEGGSLLNRVIGYLGFTPWLLHRLDMHTTGVVVMTKKKEICRPIMLQFMNGEVEKEYLCVVDGSRFKGDDSSFMIDAPIQRHEVKFMREVGETKADSKPARTTFTILQESEKANMMLLRAAPLTGRTHQIRLHARECGLPIVGDDLYNPTEHDLYSSPEELSAAARDKSLLRYGNNNPFRRKLKLHAWKINFRNPVNGQPVSFCAAPPSHMTELLTWAGMDAPST